MPQAGNQEARRADLRRWKAIALSFLIGAAVIFLGCSWWQASESGAPVWVGYVRAAAEAGMVGGLADWFAVTALFRRPLGLPIPHTAIIPRRKDEIGRSLGEFVETNFLATDVVRGKLESAGIAARAGEWLAEPAHAARIGAPINVGTATPLAFVWDDYPAAMRDKGVAPAGERGQPAKSSAKRAARQQREADRGAARPSPIQALKSAVKKAAAKGKKSGKPRKTRRS